MLDRFYHYTFLDGRLIGSEHPAALGGFGPILRHFVGPAGPCAMLTLTPACQEFRFPGLTQYHLPIDGVPARSQVADAVAVIGRHVGRGERVWVHCQQGIDRTGCVIGSYLASVGHAPADVIADLYRRFPERRRHPRMVALWAPYEAIIRSFAPA